MTENEELKNVTMKPHTLSEANLKQVQEYLLRLVSALIIEKSNQLIRCFFKKIESVETTVGPTNLDVMLWLVLVIYLLEDIVSFRCQDGLESLVAKVRTNTRDIEIIGRELDR